MDAQFMRRTASYAESNSVILIQEAETLARLDYAEIQHGSNVICFRLFSQTIMGVKLHSKGLC